MDYRRQMCVSFLKLTTSAMAPYRVERLDISPWEVCTSRTYIRLSRSLANVHTPNLTLRTLKMESPVNTALPMTKPT